MGLLTSLFLAAGGCDDSLSPEWAPLPDTVTLTSIASPVMNVPAAFDLISGVGVLLEAPGATGNWDLYLDSEDHALMLAAPGALHITSDAGILALDGLTFEEVDEAPEDGGAYVTDTPIPLCVGTVYVVRTRSTTDAYGSQCQYFGKLAPVSLDVEREVAVLVWDRNPYCYDRDLDGTVS